MDILKEREAYNFGSRYANEGIKYRKLKKLIGADGNIIHVINTIYNSIVNSPRLIIVSLEVKEDSVLIHYMNAKTGIEGVTCLNNIPVDGRGRRI